MYKLRKTKSNGVYTEIINESGSFMTLALIHIALSGKKVYNDKKIF